MIPNVNEYITIDEQASQSKQKVIRGLSGIGKDSAIAKKHQESILRKKINLTKTRPFFADTD